MRPVKLGLMLCGLGETIADVGAWLAGCIRQRSTLYPLQGSPLYKSNDELDEDARRQEFSR